MIAIEKSPGMESEPVPHVEPLVLPLTVNVLEFLQPGEHLSV